MAERMMNYPINKPALSFFNWNLNIESLVEFFSQRSISAEIRLEFPAEYPVALDSPAVSW